MLLGKQISVIWVLVSCKISLNFRRGLHCSVAVGLLLLEGEWGPIVHAFLIAIFLTLSTWCTRHQRWSLLLSRFFHALAQRVGTTSDNCLVSQGWPVRVQILEPKAETLIGMLLFVAGAAVPHTRLVLLVLLCFEHSLQLIVRIVFNLLSKLIWSEGGARPDTRRDRALRSRVTHGIVAALIVRWPSTASAFIWLTS